MTTTSDPAIPFDVFMAMSKELTADPELADSLGQLYLAELLATLGAVPVAALVDAYKALPAGGNRQDVIRSQIMENAEVGPVAREVILVLLTGATHRDVNGEPTRWESADAYFGGGVWRAARAHPPGHSDGYFGHWKYPPDR